MSPAAPRGGSLVEVRGIDVRAARLLLNMEAVMVGKNAAPLDGWVVTGRCCGELHETVECSVCLQRVKPELPLMPPSIILGEN